MASTMLGINLNKTGNTNYEILKKELRELEKGQ
jgi:hypothetical protein